MFVRTINNHSFDSPWPALALTSQLMPFGAFRQELQRVLDEQEYDAGAPAAAGFELKDTGPQLALSANLPGLKDDDLELTVTAEQLSLRGERKISVPEGFSARRQERHSYAFNRSFRLPVRIDPEKVEAKLVNGILTVTLPKAAENKPRNITVHAA